MTALLLAFGPRTTFGTTGLLILGITASTAFGVLWVNWFARDMMRLAHRLYSADPSIVPSPPAGRFDTRIMCNRLVTPRLAIGGHLYLGPDEWIFVPHRKNRRQDQSPLRLPSNRIRQVELVDLRPTGLARLISARPVPMIHVVADDSVLFLAPDASDVASELRRRAPALDRDPAA
jgi:hypothetical protein